MVNAADVVVVGAGLAGLSAAVRLHRAGLRVVVCEADDDVGGRVRTDHRDGFRLDRGFHVVLPAYPELRRLVDVDKLRPQAFTRGTVAMAPEGRRWLAGPWHGRSAVAGAADFARRHPGDSLRMASLTVRDALAPDRIARAENPRTTLAELRHRGLSQQTIDQVLRPFLAGVFLDPQLDTSARMFHLLWRIFLRGGGALPAEGIQALPRLIAADLPDGTVRTGTAVAEVTADGVVTAAGEHLPAKAVVVAADGNTAARLLPGVTAPEWHAVTTFYYRADRSPLNSPTLLVDGMDPLLMNTGVLSDVAPSYAPPGSALISASVPNRADTSLENQVRRRLSHVYGTDTDGWQLLGEYAIPHALPAFPAGTPLRRPVRIAPGRYVCGDHRDTPSQQGALVSGRRAADAAMHDFPTL